MKPRSVPAAKFKAECLSLLDEVERSRQELVVTKRGKPVARLVPIERRRPVKDMARVVGDLLIPGEPEWMR